MTDLTPAIDSNSADTKGRKGDGATYLVVADNSPEFPAALKYACFAAQRNRGRLGILRIIEDQDFQDWGKVEALMKKELREQGEKYLWTVAKTANEINGMVPSLYFAEGEPSEALMKTIEGDPNIAQLILGGGGESGPGPMISYFLGKGLHRLKIPMVIVPANIKENS